TPAAVLVPDDRDVVFAVAVKIRTPCEKAVRAETERHNPHLAGRAQPRVPYANAAFAACNGQVGFAVAVKIIRRRDIARGSPKFVSVISGRTFDDVPRARTKDRYVESPVAVVIARRK